MADLGLCINRDHVLQLSTRMGNKVCRQYKTEQVVCPPQLRSEVCTTVALDNIDHNPSSTTAKDSFHGTAIYLIQHSLLLIMKVLPSTFLYSMYIQRPLTVCQITTQRFPRLLEISRSQLFLKVGLSHSIEIMSVRIQKNNTNS